MSTDTDDDELSFFAPPYRLDGGSPGTPGPKPEEDIMPEPDIMPEQEPDPAPERRGFPTECLPEPLRAMVKHTAQQTNAPESLAAAAGLGIASASLGAAFAIASGPGWINRGNIFLLTISQSGTGKSASFNSMAAPWVAAGKRMMGQWIRETHPNLQADLELAKADLESAKKKERKKSNAAATEAIVGDAMEAAVGDATEAAVRDAMRRKTAAEAALTRAPILNIGNATGEALVENLALAPGQASAIISSEARDIVDNIMGRYSKDGKGGDEAPYVSGYTGDEIIHNRKGRPPVVAHKPCLTLSIAVQPDVWQRMSASPRLMESGFLARCLTFDSNARPMRPSSHAIPEEVKDGWAKVIDTLLAARADPFPPAVVIPSPEAKALLDDLSGEAADNREPGGCWEWCAPFAARLGENAWRLALIFHAIQHHKGAATVPLAAQTAANAVEQSAATVPLSEQTAANAVEVATWFFMETLALLSPIQSVRSAARMDKLVNIFADRETNVLAVWKLRQNHGFERPELMALAAEFPTRFRVVVGSPAAEGGRPSETVHFLPG